MYADPDPQGAWHRGVRLLASGRTVVEVSDAAVPDVPTGSMAVVTLDLDRIGVDRRVGVADAVAPASAVLLGAAPDTGSRLQTPPPETLPAWMELFAARGLLRSPGNRLHWLASWGVLLERETLAVPQLVGRYEREMLPVAAHRGIGPVDIERLLHQTDRIIGLEATLAEANYRRDIALLERQDAILETHALHAELQAVRSELEAARAATTAARSAVDAMRTSTSWRIGQAVVGPVRRAAGSARRPHAK